MSETKLQRAGRKKPDWAVHAADDIIIKFPSIRAQHISVENLDEESFMCVSDTIAAIIRGWHGKDHALTGAPIPKDLEE